MGYDVDVGGSANKIGIHVYETGTDKVQKQLSKLEKGAKKSGKVIEKSYKTQRKQLQQQTKLDNALKKNAKSTFDWYKAMLPLLFVSQAVSQSLKNMLQPANDLLDVQGIMNDFLAVAFIPTAEENLDAVLNWGTSLIGLSEDTRKSYGDQMRFATVTSDVISGMAEATLMGVGLSGSLGGVAAALATGIGGMNLLKDKQSQMVASITGPLNAALIGNMSDFDNVTVSTLANIKAVERLEAKSKEQALNDNIKMPGNSAYDSWSGALLRAVQYKSYIDKTYGGATTSGGTFNYGTIGGMQAPPLSYVPFKGTSSNSPPFNFNASGQTMAPSGSLNPINVNSAVNINASISNNVDIKHVADQISAQVRQDLLKYSTAR